MMRNWRMRSVRSLGLVIVIGAASTWACTKNAKKVEEPVAVAPKAPAAGSVPKSGAPGAVAATPPPPDTCRVITKLTAEPPVYLDGRGVVLTRIMKPCVTRDGQRGYEKGTPWLAMGFPCTGGSGRVEIKGNNYTAPKMVSFILGTDCGMLPPGREAAEPMVKAVLDMPEGSRLMALTPFVVQYWEIPGMTDADVGFSIDLRSAPALDGLWKNWRDNKPVHVRLYGRENAWVQGGHFYMVDADLKMSGRKSFQLAVTGVKSLNETELGEVKARCDQLRPQRDCSAVF